MEAIAESEFSSLNVLLLIHFLNDLQGVFAAAVASASVTSFTVFPVVCIAVTDRFSGEIQMDAQHLMNLLGQCAP